MMEKNTNFGPQVTGKAPQDALVSGGIPLEAIPRGDRRLCLESKESPLRFELSRSKNPDLLPLFFEMKEQVQNTFSSPSSSSSDPAFDTGV